MTDAQFRDNCTRAWLESWVEESERPGWYAWFGFYPAKASVAAAKARLKAMDENIEITQADALKIFEIQT